MSYFSTKQNTNDSKLRRLYLNESEYKKALELNPSSNQLMSNIYQLEIWGNSTRVYLMMQQFVHPFLRTGRNASLAMIETPTLLLTITKANAQDILLLEYVSSNQLACQRETTRKAY
jgi:hypothetical protein